MAATIAALVLLVGSYCLFCKDDQKTVVHRYHEGRNTKSRVERWGYDAPKTNVKHDFLEREMVKTQVGIPEGRPLVGNDTLSDSMPSETFGLDRADEKRETPYPDPELEKE